MKKDKSKVPVATINALPAVPRRVAGMLTDDEAKSIIVAIRRGVTGASIEDAMAVAHGTVYTRLGRWAMQRCRCFGEPK